MVKVHQGLTNLVGYDLPLERVEPASFPLPKSEDVSDALGTHLPWQAARLTLREGAAPFRSLRRISIRPQTYRFVPLLMALRLDPIRLFIADDAGVRKTIEALLVARELLDRGEIRWFCVLCPSYLCEQWVAEMAQKFDLEPGVIRSGTIGQFERQVPEGRSVYEHFPVQVASIDFVKADRNCHQFLHFCPELVIVYEVHGAAAAQHRAQRERHALLREVAKNDTRPLILLTAPPHSEIEDAFRSLLGLLRPEFQGWNLTGRPKSSVWRWRTIWCNRRGTTSSRAGRCRLFSDTRDRRRNLRALTSVPAALRAHLPLLFPDREDRRGVGGALAPGAPLRLRDLVGLREALHGPARDRNLAPAIEIVRTLVARELHPILWCRYVATTDYLAQHLRQELPADVQIVCVTGRLGDEERRVKIEEIETERPRVLVATDCLSESVNLQEKFTVVVHYDLAWNPDRPEQREGRVELYGQPPAHVKAVRFFGRDNPVDGVVIEVLLDKARTIHCSLGTYGPAPEEGESVMQAVLEVLFLRARRRAGTQLSLDLDVPQVEDLHRRWRRDAERERVNHSRFARRTLKPEEVQRELQATDAVLDDPTAVREFVLAATQRVELDVKPDRRSGVFRVAVSPEALAPLPEPIRHSLVAVRRSPLSQRLAHRLRLAHARGRSACAARRGAPSPRRGSRAPPQRSHTRTSVANTRRRKWAPVHRRGDRALASPSASSERSRAGSKRRRRRLSAGEGRRARDGGRPRDAQGPAEDRGGDPPRRAQGVDQHGRLLLPDKHVGPKEEVGTKGGSLSNRLRAVLNA